MFEEIIKFVNKSDKIIIFPHTNMDGDSVGSSKALALAFQKLGKQVEILADEPVPNHVGFLNCDLFKTAASFTPDLAFVVDCSTENRIENRLAVYESAKYKVCIDHHLGSGSFGDATVRDADSPAACFLVLDFINELGVKLDKDMAEALYTGIITDTGALKYGHLDGDRVRQIAGLFDFGINFEDICTAIYTTVPYSTLKLEAMAIDNIEVFADGKAIISVLRYDDWKALGAVYSDLETSIDAIRKLEGAEVAALLKEREPGVFKLSLRSKTYVNVANIAEKFGGGGHTKAAGSDINMDFNTAYKTVKEEICKAL